MINFGTSNESTRINWIEEKLKQIPKDSRILDAGAGEQQFKKFCSHLNYVAQDFAQYNGEGDHKGLQMGSWDQTKLDIVSDITNIPQPNESFDAILCTEVFEHLPNPILAIQEFSRLLSPNGYLIVTAPFCSLTHFSPYHFYTGFNRYFYEKYLPEFKFKILEFQENGNFFEYLAQEINRINFVANKYSDYSLNKWDFLIIKIILKLLKKLSSKDTGSQTILNFGYHILAQKTN